MKGIFALAWIIQIVVNFVGSTNDTDRQGRLLGFSVSFRFPVVYTATVYPTCYATLPSATLCTASTSSRRKKQFDYFYGEPQVPFYASPPVGVQETAFRVEGRSPVNFGYPWIPQTEVVSSFSEDEQPVRGEGRVKTSLDKARVFFLGGNSVTSRSTLYKTKILLATTTGPTVTYTVGCTTAGGYPTPICPAQTCTSNTNCPAALPSCTNGVCIKCTANSQCPSSKPYCVTSSGVCSECINSNQCLTLYGGSLLKASCNVTTGTCVGCVTNAPICFPPTDVCDGNTGQCRACLTNQECVLANAGTTCTAGVCG